MTFSVFWPSSQDFRRLAVPMHVFQYTILPPWYYDGKDKRVEE